MTIGELCKYNGIGEAKAITIIAACELGKRRQHEKVKERKKISNSQDIYEYMHPMMQDLNTEEAWVLLMNQNFKLIKSARISRGGITETSVDVRIIIKEAVLANATVIALCHNHPSGNIEPSAEDNRITEKVRMACKTMRLHFLDHVIVTDGGYYSFHDNGR
jgi:DNA repair protein RadC